MKIQRITPMPNFCAKSSSAKLNKQNNKHKNPMQDGLSTAGAWFGFGIGFDLLSRKLQFSKSPMKNSLAINGILGTGAGIYTGIQNKKHQSEIN